jgi:tRNA(Arg) A34 adenosine deaminase TadA
MKDVEYMEMAVKLAGESKEPVRCGCVLVQNGHIIAGTFNSQREDRQVVNHAEIKALQAANRHLNSRTLADVTAYCSCEPCVMCLTALSLARIERVVYAKTMKEVAPDDPMAQVDSVKFSQQLNFVPKLEQLVVS